MGWAVGYSIRHSRDVGYGVPAICDHPDCHTEIDRGLSYVCGGEPDGGEEGCGLFFCSDHLYYYKGQLCERCSDDLPAFDPKPDTSLWVRWKLNDESWATWRQDNPEQVKALQALMSTVSSVQHYLDKQRLMEEVGNG